MSIEDPSPPAEASKRSKKGFAGTPRAPAGTLRLGRWCSLPAPSFSELLCAKIRGNSCIFVYIVRVVITGNVPALVPGESVAVSVGAIHYCLDSSNFRGLIALRIGRSARYYVLISGRS